MEIVAVTLLALGQIFFLVAVLFANRRLDDVLRFMEAQVKINETQERINTAHRKLYEGRS